MDATLLATEYDAVIVGTGMAEAILAGALARAGKKVLHLDQNDYYGSNYASFPLEQFRRWTRNEPIAPREFDEGDGGKTHAADEQQRWEEVEEEQPRTRTQVLPLLSAFKCHLVEEKFHVSEEQQEELLRQSSQFSIDVNPRLVLSSEEIVQILIESGVGRYLEFAAIERTYMQFDDQAGSDRKDVVWEVPCSKKDVFASKLLGMVEKRMLMKFLQFVADYGETHILGEDVKSKNERELALGRSLKRPQNKANQVESTVGDDIAQYLDAPFQELLSKHFKLSPKLQQVVVFCVALASFPVDNSGQSEAQQMTAREGLAAVYRYVASIGRFTGNAFLVPLYGVSEITQSFCRLCAVYGGIYILRAPIDGFVVNEDTNEMVGIRTRCEGKEDIIKAKHIITNASYLGCFSSPLSKTLTSSQVLRGVFVLKKSLRDAMSRFMIVVPPNDPTLGNPFAVQVIQLDHGAYICPKDHFLVQITMPLPTEWEGNTANQRELMDAIIKKLVESAVAEKVTKKNSQGDAQDDGEEPSWLDLVVWSAVFAIDHYLFPYSNATKRAEYNQPSSLPTNLWISETPFGTEEKSVNPLEIHLESSCINARAIFEKICPGELFLPKSASAEQAEREEMEDEEDAVLKAAKKLAEETVVSDVSRDVSTESSNVTATTSQAETPSV